MFLVFKLDEDKRVILITELEDDGSFMLNAMLHDYIMGADIHPKNLRVFNTETQYWHPVEIEAYISDPDNTSSGEEEDVANDNLPEVEDSKIVDISEVRKRVNQKNKKNKKIL